MKKYIRYFDNKSFWNFLFKGKVFVYQPKYGFYMMKNSPTIYLKKFSDSVKAICVKDYDSNSSVDLTGKDYFNVTQNQYVDIQYKNGNTITLLLFSQN